MKQLIFSVCTLLLFVSCTKEQKNTTRKSITDTPTFIEADKAINETETAKPLRNPISNPKYSPKSLYGIWTLDNNGPHADFELTAKSFFVIDYDGDGDMPYSIRQDTLTVMYSDYNSIGIIKSVTKDSLVIDWDNGGNTNYVRWTN